MTDQSNGNRRRPRAARVRRTGIALVHEGELVMPAAGSEAQADRVIGDSRNTIHYHFPVEIEVRNLVSGSDANTLIQQVLHTVAGLVENNP